MKKKMAIRAEIVEFTLESDVPPDVTAVDRFEISSEQVRILLLACSGFALTDEEREQLRPAHQHIFRAWQLTQ